MLINELRSHSSLNSFITDTCCENNICVEIDSNILPNDYIVIKVDQFYSSNVPSPDTPKSPDCIIIVRCQEGHFHMFIVELKNVQSQSGRNLKRKAIREKFETCLLDFMSNRFRNQFYNTQNEFKLRLWLVAGRVNDKYTKNFKFDFLLGLRPLTFGSKKYMIEGMNHNTKIHSC